MPVREHYKGHGEEVMSAMRKTYKDPEKAKRVFYATENARKNEKKKGQKRGSKR
jgi:hypothetical protein